MNTFIHTYEFIINCLAAIAGALIALLIVMIGAEAIFRAFEISLFRGVIDIAEYSLFFIAILAAPWLLRRNGHIQVTLLTGALRGQSKRVSDTLINLVVLLVCLVILYYSTHVFIEAYSREDMVFKELEFPEWWLQWAMPVSMLLMSIESTLRLLGIQPAPVKSPKEHATQRSNIAEV